jgi:hypothetical protein
MFEEHPFGKGIGNSAEHPDQEDGPSVCQMSCSFEDQALGDLVGTPEQRDAFERMVATSALATIKAESITL